MKNLKVILVFVAGATFLTSCKETEKEMAEERVDSFTNYVDSISNVAADKSAETWNDVEVGYNKAKMDAEAALANATDKETYQAKLDKANMKYEDYKAQVVEEKNKMDRETANIAIRTTLLGKDYTGNDYSFNWVNKTNILSVYDNFVTTVEKNKDNYSREDWDEIKLIYEALDTRKNTVEKEGLSSSDNLKIASLKVKFSKLYTVNRVGAKSEENAEAKK